MVDRKAASKGIAGPKSGKKGNDEKQELDNHAVVRERLQKLALPVREQYGESAFDELLSRLEATIEEFTHEYETLFTELIDQSKDDYRRLQNLMAPDEATEAAEEATEPEVATEELSEIERRLEGMEHEETAEGD